MRTWHVEMLVVAVAMASVAFFGGGSIEWLGSVAVVLTFGHAQVASRLAEREASRPRPDVACHAWNTRYLVGKELLWLLYFVLHHSWSALAGVGLFLAYPLWRRWWRKTHPLET